MFMWSIPSCPIQFHDLLEIIDFLFSLSSKYLYLFDGLVIYCSLQPAFRIRIFYDDGLYYIALPVYR